VSDFVGFEVGGVYVEVFGGCVDYCVDLLDVGVLMLFGVVV